MSEIIGQKIRKIRKLRKMSLSELAVACQWKHQSAIGRLSNYERGDREPCYDDMKVISHALNVPVAYFYDEDNIINIDQAHPIPNWLKALREAVNLTQLEFAKELNLTRSSINNYENGHRRPKYYKAKKIIEFAKKNGIELTLDHIFSEGENEK